MCSLDSICCSHLVRRGMEGRNEDSDGRHHHHHHHHHSAGAGAVRDGGDCSSGYG